MLPKSDTSDPEASRPSVMSRLLTSIVNHLSSIISGGAVRVTPSPALPPPERFSIGDDFDRWEAQTKLYLRQFPVELHKATVFGLVERICFWFGLRTRPHGPIPRWFLSPVAEFVNPALPSLGIRPAISLPCPRSCWTVRRLCPSSSSLGKNGQKKPTERIRPSRSNKYLLIHLTDNDKGSSTVLDSMSHLSMHRTAQWVYLSNFNEKSDKPVRLELSVQSLNSYCNDNCWPLGCFLFNLIVTEKVRYDKQVKFMWHITSMVQLCVTA